MNAKSHLVGLLVLGVGLLSGCSVLVPFDQTFMCEETNDYGRCQNVQSAYEDAQQGKVSSSAGESKQKSKGGDRGKESSGEDRTEIERERYQRAAYHEMAKLIEQPVTPLVKAPTVLRTMITSYNTSGKTLYMPRYIFYFGDEAEFVLGDYLDARHPDRVGPSLSPLGVK